MIKLMNLILEEEDPNITYKDEKGNSHTAKMSSLLKYAKDHPGYKAAEAAKKKADAPKYASPLVQEPEDPYTATAPHTGLGGWRGSMRAEPQSADDDEEEFRDYEREYQHFGPDN